MNRLIPLAVAGLLMIPVGVAFLPVGNEPAGPAVNATIMRDAYGVPHIYAGDVYGLFYANGYAQAQDRLVQMEILRHVGKGELASLTGGQGSLEMDLVTRRELYTEEERQATIAHIRDNMTEASHGIDGTLWYNAFDAFADGVNQFIEETRQDPSILPGEYVAFGTTPRDWLISDTVAIAEYLLDIFGRGSGGNEDARARLLLHLQDTLGPSAGAAAFTDFVPGVQNEETYTTIAQADINEAGGQGGGKGEPKAEGAKRWEHAGVINFYDDLSDLSVLLPSQQEAVWASRNASNVDDARGIQDTLAALGASFKFGSNAQVIDKAFSANGENLLYGGPQMAYYAPMIPYELALHGAGFEAAGMGVAGAPGVIIGRGPTHAWTVTSGSSDQVDMVVEKLVPGEPEQYYTDFANGTIAQMDCRDETHYVRPGPVDFLGLGSTNPTPPDVDVVEQRVCRTVHGPVLKRADANGDGEDDYAFASHRSFRGDEARSGILWLQAGRTRDIADMQHLLESFKFSFNFNIAEDGEEGATGYLHVGAQPLRHLALDGRLPTPGWVPGLAWDHQDPADLLMGSELPNMINSTKGYTVNWNNNPSQGFHTGDNMEKWGSMQRAELMDELLTARMSATGNALTMADLRDVHFWASVSDPYGDEFYSLMRGAAIAAGDAIAVAAVDQWHATGYFYGGYGVDNNGEVIFDFDNDGTGDFATTMPDGMALFELWRDELQELVFRDELAAATRTFTWHPPTGNDPHAADHGTEGNKHSVLFDAMRNKSGHAWCDDQGTGSVETCQDLALAAMQAVLADPDAEWQQMPNRISQFAALGAAPAYEIPMTNRPSFQTFYDWGLMDVDPDAASRNVLPPGTSGHMNTLEMMQIIGEGYGWPADTPLHPEHLDDQLTMYVDFQDKALHFWTTAAEASGECTTFTSAGTPTNC